MVRSCVRPHWVTNGGHLGTVNYEQTKSLFRDFLSIFNRLLLPTHDSSHVQFLLLHICSFHTVLFAAGTFDECLDVRSVGLQRRIHEQLLEDIRLTVGVDGISASVDLLPVELDRSSEVHHDSVGSTTDDIESVSSQGKCLDQRCTSRNSWSTGCMPT